MPESLRTRLERHLFNLMPAYRGTGARIRYIAADWREVRVELPLSWRTRNVVGTIFGGSIYGAVDPVYMLMLMRNLGRGYLVWDKAALIRFRKPGRGTLTARFALEAAELGAIREALERERSVDRVYEVVLTDASGEVCARVEKTIYVRRVAPGDAAPLAARGRAAPAPIGEGRARQAQRAGAVARPPGPRSPLERSRTPSEHD